MQVRLAELVAEQYERKLWTPPQRELLRLRELEATVTPIYSRGDLAGRARALDFLSAFHYLHKARQAKQPNFTWIFGLFLCGQLAGVVGLNPPAAGVPVRYFGRGSAYGAGMIGINRTCCHDAAPFNSESMMVSAALRMLPRLDHRFHTVIAQSDLSVVDDEQRTHCGILYMGCNGWWAGHTNSGQWRGFYDPQTGARISRKVGGRDRALGECPEGWEIEPSKPLTNFLWFVGPKEREAREQLVPKVKVLVREGVYPVWRHPADLQRGTPRAYSAQDKQMRQSAVA